MDATYFDDVFLFGHIVNINILNILYNKIITFYYDSYNNLMCLPYLFLIINVLTLVLIYDVIYNKINRKTNSMSYNILLEYDFNNDCINNLLF